MPTVPSCWWCVGGKSNLTWLFLQLSVIVILLLLPEVSKEAASASDLNCCTIPYDLACHFHAIKRSSSASSSIQGPTGGA
jgi:hypothetical protein